VLQELGDPEGAKAQHERALEISEATLGPDHRNVAAACNDLGRVLHALGDLEGARAQLERALEISEAALGPDQLDRGHRPQQPR
jgi:tetratricopeptide (TPR) repeat protein